MEIVVSGRAGGKTHQLVEAAVLEKLGGGYPLIMVRDGRAQYLTEKRVFDTLCQHGVTRPKAEEWAKEMVSTPTLLVDRRGHAEVPSLYIDNLEECLTVLFRAHPKMVTDNAPVRTPQGKRFEPFADNPYARVQL